MLLSEAIKELQNILEEYGDGLLLIDAEIMGSYLDIIEFVPGAYSSLRDEDNCVLVSAVEYSK